MYATIGYEVNMKLHHAWMAWLDMFDVLPFWDPYGAVTAIGFMLVGVFFGGRWLIGTHW